MEQVSKTRVLAVFDHRELSAGVVNYLHLLSRVQPISVTALFLPKPWRQDPWTDVVGGTIQPEWMDTITDADKAVLRENVSRFKQMIGELIPHKVRTVQPQSGIAELVIESRFSELLVLGNDNFFREESIDRVGSHLKNLLLKSECPVLYLPATFEFPGSNIIAYDGSEASVFAIKQYVQLFPQWCKNATWLVFSGDERQDMPYGDRIREFANSHFPEITYSIVAEVNRHAFQGWLNERKGAVLISGAFGRSSVSESIRKSFITEAVVEHRLPLFTAHP